MNLRDEYKISKVVFIASFVTFFVEIIIATDVFVPVDWNNAVIPSFVYFLAVRHARKSTSQRWTEERLLLVKIARSHLMISSGLSFLYHLRELLGPCGISHKTLLETCANLSGDSDPKRLSRCHTFLRNVNSYYLDQNKCAWIVLGNPLGSLFYVSLFSVRVGLAMIGPAFVHLSYSGGGKRTRSIDVLDFQSMLYVCGTSLVSVCLLVETISSVSVHYTLFNVDPCVFYFLGAYAFFSRGTDRNRDLKENLWRLCVSVTFLYSAADFLRNYLLYHVSICSQNFDVDQFCHDDGGTNRCLRTILESSETISKLFDCPVNKLGPWKASIVRNCQLTRFLFLVFHQGLTLAFGKVKHYTDTDECVAKRKISDETCESAMTAADSSTRCRLTS